MGKIRTISTYGLTMYETTQEYPCQLNYRPIHTHTHIALLAESTRLISSTVKLSRFDAFQLQKLWTRGRCQELFNRSQHLLSQKTNVLCPKPPSRRPGYRQHDHPVYIPLDVITSFESSAASQCRRRSSHHPTRHRKLLFLEDSPPFRSLQHHADLSIVSPRGLPTSFCSISAILDTYCNTYGRPHLELTGAQRSPPITKNFPTSLRTAFASWGLSSES